MTAERSYPSWRYYPSRERPPGWANDFIGVVADAEASLHTAQPTSDTALAALRPGLEGLGYRVEVSKSKKDRITLPVLFGDQGHPRVTYEVDAVQDELGVLVEIEAGRGARGNAVYRDLIRASLIVDARFFALGVLETYRHQSGGREVTVSSYADARSVLDAVFASQRLRLPFEGVLLFGY